MKLFISAIPVVLFFGSLCSQGHYPEIESLLESGNLSKAEEKIRSVFKSDTSSFDYMCHMGRLERERENYPLAEMYFKVCIRIDPLVLRPYGILAELNRYKKNYKEAHRYTDMALKIDSTNVDFYNEKAIMYNEQQEYEHALFYLQKAMDKSPEDHYFIYNYGVALNHMKRYKEATLYFDKAQKTAPTDPKIYYDRGYAYFYLNEPEKAIADLKISLKYNSVVTNDYERPKKYATYFILADSYAQLDKPFKAFRNRTKAYKYRKRDL